MRHINVIMQNHLVQTLSTTDISHSIRGRRWCNWCTYFLGSDTFYSRFQSCGPIWYTCSFAERERERKRACVEWQVQKEKQNPVWFWESIGLVGFLSPLPLLLIYPSVFRGHNYSWKVEQGSGFYVCRERSSEWWLKEVRSEAINYWGRKVTGL